ncbi:MAG: AMP-binding protein [Arenicella sp.]
MNRFWLEEYQQGVPHDIDVNQYQSVADVFRQSTQEYPERIAFSNFGTQLSFSQLDKETAKMSAYYQGVLGLSKGDKVAIMLPNILQYPIALFGAQRAGLTVVNVDPMYTARELKHQLNDSGAKALVFLENFANVVEAVLPEVGVEHLVMTRVGDYLNFPKSVLINFVLKYVKKMVPKHGIQNFDLFNHVLEQGAKQLDGGFQNIDAELNHDDIAFLQYTGGTTGVSKGAILTHGNITANVAQARAWINPVISAGEERMITALPLYHIFSLTANCLYIMSMGGENILITNPRDFKGFIKILQKEKFSCITGVNTLYRKMLDTPGFDEIDFSNMKITFAGGMAVTQDVADEWKQRTGNTVVEAYGLTETSPAACINPMNLKDYNGTIGLPISSTLIKIIDAEGNDLGMNEPGELCIKGPQVTQGYWNLPELKDTTFTSDGYFRTGDIAQVNEKGYVKLLDRMKDMILVSGFNVYPNELDDVLSSHPKILEAAVIGIDDDVMGQSVKAFIVKSDDSLTEDEVKAYCKENLTGYKRPREIEFLDELPKSNVGKILRKELR